MDNQHLRDLLEQLHTELQTTDVDTTAQALLHQLQSDVQIALERSGENVAYPPVQASLQAAILHFEQDHPTLTVTMTRLLDLLSQLGL